MQQFRFDAPGHLQAFAQPCLLDLEIGLGQGDFLGHADFMPAVAGQGRAQELGQLADHAACVAATLFGHQRGNGVEGVEQEMRVQLVAQGAQFRVARQQMCLFALLLRLLEFHVVGNHRMHRAERDQGEPAAFQSIEQIRDAEVVGARPAGESRHQVAEQVVEHRHRVSRQQQRAANQRDRQAPAPQAALQRHQRRQPGEERQQVEHPVGGGVAVAQRGQRHHHQAQADRQAGQQGQPERRLGGGGTGHVRSVGHAEATGGTAAP